MLRLILVLSVLGCSLAQFNNRGQYNRFNNYNRYNNIYNPQPRYYTTPAPLPAVTVQETESQPADPAPPQVHSRFLPIYARTPEHNAITLKSNSDLNPDGHFQYNYETSNGITAHAVGVPRNLGGVPPNIPTVIEGSFSWVSPEGKPVSISYIADEYGYRAVGDAIPTPPPIPEAILRSLQYQGVRLANKK